MKHTYTHRHTSTHTHTQVLILNFSLKRSEISKKKITQETTTTTTTTEQLSAYLAGVFPEQVDLAELLVGNRFVLDVFRLHRVVQRTQGFLERILKLGPEINRRMQKNDKKKSVLIKLNRAYPIIAHENQHNEKDDKNQLIHEHIFVFLEHITVVQSLRPEPAVRGYNFPQPGEIGHEKTTQHTPSPLTAG